jgi:hypothetical protein
MAESISASYPDVLFEFVSPQFAVPLAAFSPGRLEVVAVERAWAPRLVDLASAAASNRVAAHALLAKHGPSIFLPSPDGGRGLTGHAAIRPSSVLLATALLLELSFGLSEEAALLERAVSTRSTTSLASRPSCGRSVQPSGVTQTESSTRSRAPRGSPRLVRRVRRLCPPSRATLFLPLATGRSCRRPPAACRAAAGGADLLRTVHRGRGARRRAARGAAPERRGKVATIDVLEITTERRRARSQPSTSVCSTRSATGRSTRT